MGAFSHSYVVAQATPQEVLAFYQAQGTRAFIYPDVRQYCAICDDNDDEADLDGIIELTAQLQATALLGQVFDSAVFAGTLVNRGTVVDEYIDHPDYLALDPPTGDSILFLNRTITIEQRAIQWASAFGVPNQKGALVDVIRRREEYLFAEDFHTAILNSLGLPDAMVGQSYIDCERAYNTYPETRKILLHPNSNSQNE